MGCRSRLALVAIFTLCLLAAEDASANVRYAGPDGGEVDPCEDPSNPCSIYAAADETAPGTTVEAGDEVILEPGNYSDTAGDLGPENFARIATGVKVFGKPDASRPVITLNIEPNLGGAFFLGNEQTKLAHLEIDTAMARTNFELFSGTVEDVIARSSSEVASTIVCTQFNGIIRDSACIATGGGAAAVGVSDIGGAPFTPTLRNVTVIATGAESRGLSYDYFKETSGTISAKSVIAQGVKADVRAGGHEIGGSSTINLDHSDYESTEAEGTASVTALNTESNIEAAPLLASDQIHQLCPARPQLTRGRRMGRVAPPTLTARLAKLGQRWTSAPTSSVIKPRPRSSAIGAP